MPPQNLPAPITTTDAPFAYHFNPDSLGDIAAQREHLAQPSLSQQVRKLEDELGTKWFDRLGRTVRLTQLGEAFLPRAETIMRQIDAAKIEIQEMAGTEQGKLRQADDRRQMPGWRIGRIGNGSCLASMNWAVNCPMICPPLMTRRVAARRSCPTPRRR
jgi:hypothetical protein